jgi:hypothetical protein
MRHLRPRGQVLFWPMVPCGPRGPGYRAVPRMLLPPFLPRAAGPMPRFSVLFALQRWDFVGGCPNLKTLRRGPFFPVVPFLVLPRARIFSPPSAGATIITVGGPSPTEPIARGAAGRTHGTAL